MNTKKLVFGALLSASSLAGADEPSAARNMEDLTNLCMYVVSRDENTEPRFPLRYHYQFVIYQAAGVDPQDDPEQIRRKIGSFWDRYEHEIRCNSLQFDFINGSLLKVAVLMDFDAVLRDAIRWKVDLNRVDESDQRTVLDYVRHRAERAGADSATGRTMNQYYEMLRKAGAKHRAEL